MQNDPATVAMFDALMHQRRSVRGFLPDPVPSAVLESIFATAQASPSNCNVQPWVVHVVSGDAAKKMRTDLPAHVMSGCRLPLIFR